MKGLGPILECLAGLLTGRRFALQVGAICRCPSSGDVLLITSRGTGRWVIPKGWPMRGKSLSVAAEIEAWEEAGVRGRIGTTEIGRFRYNKTRKGVTPVEVRVFLLEADCLTADFPEAGQRRRRWFSPAEAAASVAEPGLGQILLSLPVAAARPEEAPGQFKTADRAGNAEEAATAGSVPARNS